MDNTLGMGRSSKLEAYRAYQTWATNLFLMCRTPPKIQTEPRDSFEPGDGLS